MTGNRGLAREALTEADTTSIFDRSGNRLGLEEIAMKLRLILIGMAAGLLLPLAAANAGAVFDPGLIQTGAGTALDRGAAPTAENFGRKDEDKGDHDRGDHDRKCDKSPIGKDRDCDRDDKHDHDRKCDRDDKNGKCDKDDKDHRDK
jgi:hypothetical protein